MLRILTNIIFTITAMIVIYIMNFRDYYEYLGQDKLLFHYVALDSWIDWFMLFFTEALILLASIIDIMFIVKQRRG